MPPQAPTFRLFCSRPLQSPTEEVTYPQPVPWNDEKGRKEQLQCIIRNKENFEKSIKQTTNTKAISQKILKDVKS